MSSKYKCYSKQEEDWKAPEIFEGNKKKSAGTITWQKENSCAGPWWEKGAKGILKMERRPNLLHRDTQRAVV